MTSWKMTLQCSKAEAEAIETADPFADWETPPVLLANEPDAHTPDVWEIVAYSETAPSAALIAVLQSLAPSAHGVMPQVEALADEDWVTLSQQGLEPISAGRFHVHTPHYPAAPDRINFMIDAGLAFGTGQHATTHGCLFAIDALGLAGSDFRNILDLGTGTGLLAFAALKVWPEARVAASDIDPVAIDVSRANAAINQIALGEKGGTVHLIVADGMDAPDLAARAPFDLIIANVLAQPLIDMAADIVEGLARDGRLILSGLLITQAVMVADAYRARGMILEHEAHHDDWAVLVMNKTST